jgi:hypothetical protein
MFHARRLRRPGNGSKIKSERGWSRKNPFDAVTIPD